MVADSDQGKSVENEFERLGENLRMAVEQAWQSEERKQISEDLKTGIDDLGKALNRTANEFIESPTGQRLRADMDEWSRRVEVGEVSEKVDSELVRVLNRLNMKLEEAISSMASDSGGEDLDQES